ncbi:MAG: hypothetical protein H0X65_23790 [Gemmatimonadetes bacterium]|nr:hypothetical protein [Gemmatimonadota bacterium]
MSNTPHVFDPAVDELPATLMADASYPGPVVLLVNASNDARWAADASLAIASGWARQGQRIVLADLHLEEPILHERVGEANLDGIVDIFLYGASVARSARPPSGRDFYLIPAGTYTAKPEEVYSHPRWGKLVTGFKDAQATLLLFVPATAGLESLEQWSTRAVFLGDPGGDPGALIRPLREETEVEAVLVPPGSAGGVADDETPGSAAESFPPGGERGAAPEFDLEEERQTESFRSVVPRDEKAADPAPERTAHLDADTTQPLAETRWDESRASHDDSTADIRIERVAPLGGPRPEDVPHAPAPDTSSVQSTAPPPPRALRTEEVAHRRRGRRSSGPGPLMWAFGALGLLLGAVALGAIVRPDLFGRGAPAPGTTVTADTTNRAEASPSPAAPTPVVDPLPYAVQVRAYTSLPPAHDQVSEHADRLPETAFYVVPELTQGVLYYKVMAGLLPDTVAAAQTRRRLVATGVVSAADARDDAPGAWSLIQTRPLAFDLGEFATSEEAGERGDSLIDRGIPTYAVQLPYSDGSERWRLYGGAFPDSANAEEMRQMLVGANLPARLVRRMGRAPATP